MANPAWFNFSTYMANKLASIKAADPDGNWDAQKLSDAFSAAGFPGEEGAYAHFQQYGNSADENISPNANFIPSQYYIFKAASYYNKAVADVTDAEAASISTAIHDAGMSAWQHYIDYGTAEKINPSNNFDTAKYLEAKAAALNAQAGTSEWTADKVAEAFKDAGMNALEHAILYSADDTPGEAAKAFNDNGSVNEAYSVTEKAAEGDDGGKTFTLSAGNDYADQTTASTMNGTVTSDFHFTNGNDTVNSVAGTLGGGDILVDGSTSDNDVLNATVTNTPAPKLTNIETINLTVQSANAGLDMTDVIGTNNVSVKGGQNGVLNNIQKAAIPDVTVDGYAKQLTLNFADLTGTTKGGDAETLNLTVKGGTAKTIVALADGDAGGTLENLNITSSGDAGNVLTVKGNTDVGYNPNNPVSLETIQVSGTQDLDLRVTHDVINGITLSASDLSGKLGLTIDRDGKGTNTTNLTDVSGVTTYAFADSDSTTNDALVASGIATGSTVVAKTGFATAGSSLTVSGAASNSSDTLTVELGDAGASKAGDVSITDLTIANVETINLNVVNGKTADTLELIADSAKTINVAGDTALNLTLSGATTLPTTVAFDGEGNHTFVFKAAATYADKGALTLDGGSASGKLVLDGSNFGGSADNTLTINGGSGDDVLTGSANVKVTNVISAGEGKDDVSVSTAAAKNTVDLGKDDDADTLTIAAGTDNAVSVTNFTVGNGGDVLTLTDAITLKATGGVVVNTADITTVAAANTLVVYSFGKFTNAAALQAMVTTNNNSAALGVCDDTGLAELYINDMGAVRHVATFTDVKLAGLADFDASNVADWAA